MRTELEALGGSGAFADKVTFGGPDVPLRKSAVEMLSLAIHELPTNATQIWRARQRDRPLVGDLADRRDAAGPASRAGMDRAWYDDRGRPGAAAYGRSLIEQALPYSLSAETKFELGADVLRCVISLPFAAGVNEVVRSTNRWRCARRPATPRGRGPSWVILDPNDARKLGPLQRYQRTRR